MLKKWLCGAALAGLLASCASSGTKSAAPNTKPEDGAAKPVKQDKPEAPPASFAEFPAVTFKSGPATLDVAVRGIGAQAGGGIVTIQGIDVRAVPEFDFQHTAYENAVKAVAKAVYCVALREPYYYFVVPEGYEMLLGTQIGTPFPQRYESIAAPMAFGFNTKIFNVLASLSQFGNGAIAADNIIGEQAVGEMVLGNAPLRSGIEAVLRSARIAPGAFRVEATEEYIFIAAAGNTAKANPLLNEAALSGEQRALLERRVTVSLPAAQTDAKRVSFAESVSQLGDVLTLLSTQIGMSVEAEPALLELPVNPCVLNSVRVRTALDLLVRQWPFPRFGYEVQGQRILLRAP